MNWEESAKNQRKQQENCAKAYDLNWKIWAECHKIQNNYAASSEVSEQQWTENTETQRVKWTNYELCLELSQLDVRMNDDDRELFDRLWVRMKWN